LRLLALGVARFAGVNERLAEGALEYLAIRVCLSYFVAGVMKLSRPERRRGSALLSPSLCAGPIGLAFLFHLANVFVVGGNEGESACAFPVAGSAQPEPFVEAKSGFGWTCNSTLTLMFGSSGVTVQPDSMA